jgi:hypothetical protein
MLFNNTFFNCIWRALVDGVFNERSQEGNYIPVENIVRIVNDGSLRITDDNSIRIVTE